MIEEIDNFVANAGWTEERHVPDLNLDREMVKLFHMLKSGIPFPLVKTFFVEFDESDSFNVVRYFDEFKQRPDVRARIENMKELIRRRQAVPLKIPQDVLRQGGIIDGPAERKYRQTMIVDDGEIGRLRARAMSPTQRPRIMFGLRANTTTLVISPFISVIMFIYLTSIYGLEIQLLRQSHLLISCG